MKDPCKSCYRKPEKEAENCKWCDSYMKAMYYQGNLDGMEGVKPRSNK
jgi:formate dehydrogenase maturation protein FdhE